MKLHTANLELNAKIIINLILLGIIVKIINGVHNVNNKKKYLFKFNLLDIIYYFDINIYQYDISS